MDSTDSPGKGTAALRRDLASRPGRGSPSLDMHQQETLVVAQPLGPVYNTLIHFDKQLLGDTEERYIFSASR